MPWRVRRLQQGPGLLRGQASGKPLCHFWQREALGGIGNGMPRVLQVVVKRSDGSELAPHGERRLAPQAERELHHHLSPHLIGSDSAWVAPPEETPKLPQVPRVRLHRVDRVAAVGAEVVEEAGHRVIESDRCGHRLHCVFCWHLPASQAQ